MAKIESSFFDIRTLDTLSCRDSPLHRVDPRVKCLVTMAFVVAVMSFDKYAVSRLLPFAVYPVALIASGGLPAGYLLRKVLLAAPFALLVGVFNPVWDTEVLWRAGPVGISGGWISFASIMVRFVLTVSAALILIASTFLCWIANNAAITFMGVILKSMGANDRLIAFAVVIGAVIEIPFMAFSGRLIQRFGPVRLLWFALLLQVVRFFLLSRMKAPEWAIAINTLNGPGFVLFWNSALNLVSRLAPPSLTATAQGLFASSISLAGIISSVISGVSFDQLGPSGLFLVMAAFCLAAWVIFSLGIKFAFSPSPSSPHGAAGDSP